jgi:hypothetical protein
VSHLRNVKEPIEIKYNDDGTIQPIDAYFGDDIPPGSKAPDAPAAPEPAAAPAPAAN